MRPQDARAYSRDHVDVCAQRGFRSTIEPPGHRESHRNLRRTCRRRRFRRSRRPARGRHLYGRLRVRERWRCHREDAAGQRDTYEDGTPRTKHVTTNIAIEIDEAAGTAVSRSYFTALQALPDLTLQPIVSGRYHDRFERRDGQWRFVQRHVRTDLLGDMSRHLRGSGDDAG